MARHDKLGEEKEKINKNKKDFWNLGINGNRINKLSKGLGSTDHLAAIDLLMSL
jgi:hypothetical protein